jgi:Zn-dependent protease with chaperone function
MLRSLFVISALLGLAACAAPVATTTGPGATAQLVARTPSLEAKRTFLAVVQTVEPVAENECRARTTGVNCDFNIVIDERPGQAANAYQTVDRSGRPIVAFTLSMIDDARNADEIAFVMSHEAAHHIRGHLQRQRDNEVASAILAGSLAALVGGNSEVVRSAQQTGAIVGARAYSKIFELEADELGTIIAARAGYDPLRGALFFDRIPDPGDAFLGTHPPNAQRQEVVRETARRIQ